jgi:hypothetical protein
LQCLSIDIPVEITDKVEIGTSIQVLFGNSAYNFVTIIDSVSYQPVLQNNKISNTAFSNNWRSNTYMPIADNFEEINAIITGKKIRLLEYLLQLLQLL